VSVEWLFQNRIGGSMGLEEADDREAWEARAEYMREHLNLSGVLVQLAKRGQLLDLQCEMPSCYCPKGRKHFDAKTNPMTDWAPNPDHYPILRMAGGELKADNIRLAHVRCNNIDYRWRTSIKPMLAEGMSLSEIAAELNKKRVPRPHGEPTWTARSVRRVFVS
jgi:Recombinase